MPDSTNRPTNRVAFYGTPQQFAHWLESNTQLVNAEPDETFSDFNVRIAARRFVNRLRSRLGLPPTWQETNPGICCSCRRHMSGYTPAAAPICDECAAVLSEPDDQ